MNSEFLPGPEEEPQITQIAQIKGFFIRDIRVIRGQKKNSGKAVSFDTKIYINLGQKYRGKTHSTY